MGYQVESEEEGEEVAETLATSWINGNISYVKGQVQNDLSLFAQVALALEEMYGESSMKDFVYHFARN